MREYSYCHSAPCNIEDSPSQLMPINQETHLDTMLVEAHMVPNHSSNSSSIAAQDCAWQAASSDLLKELDLAPMLLTAHAPVTQPHPSRSHSECLAAPCTEISCHASPLPQADTMKQHACLRRGSTGNLSALNWTSQRQIGARCRSELDYLSAQRHSGHCCSWLCTGCCLPVAACSNRPCSQYHVAAEPAAGSDIALFNGHLSRSSPSPWSMKHCIHGSAINTCGSGSDIGSEPNAMLQLPLNASLSISPVSSNEEDLQRSFLAPNNLQNCAVSTDHDQSVMTMPSCSPTPSLCSKSDLDSDLARWLSSLTQDASNSQTSTSPLAVPCSSVDVPCEPAQDPTRSVQLEGIQQAQSRHYAMPVQGGNVPESSLATAYPELVEVKQTYDRRSQKFYLDQARTVDYGKDVATRHASGSQSAAVNTCDRPRKRRRARYDQVRRIFACPFPGCTKSYGKLQHLNTHLGYMKHGDRQCLQQYGSSARRKAKAPAVLEKL